MNSGVIFFLVAILIVGILLFAVITATRPKQAELDKEKYQAKWLKIEHELDRADPKTYPLAILEADKLLDQALTETRVVGNTMGERLKAARGMFTSINSIWYVHKLRNQIAHEHGFAPTFQQATRSLANIKQGLKDLDAI